jgi:chromate transport protein ChrA
VRGACAASKMFQVHLLATCFLAFLASVAGVNFFITLGVCGLFNILWQQSKWSVWVWRALATLLLALCLVAYVLVVIYSGRPSQLSLGAGVVSGHNGGALFLLGLLAGLLTFGGAYTAVPYVQQDAVVIAGWLTSQAFLDALALTSVLPTPLVMFVTFVGYSGAGVSGAFLITIGMFLPAFSFPLLGHEFFERIIRVRLVAVFLDGVMSGVIGIVMVSATQLIKTAVSTPIQAAIFTLSLIVLDKFEHKLTTPLLIIFLAVAGQLLFVD